MRIARWDGTLQMLMIALLALTGILIFLLGSETQPAAPFSLVSNTRLRASADQQPAGKTEELIWSLQDRIRYAPQDSDAHALLGAAYVQRARETGDPSYYGKATAVLDVALKHEPQHVEALIGKGMLALAQHQFGEALALGEQARTLNPNVPQIYGVIGDAQIELGMYPEAVQTIQMMVDLRPDLSSYSRVSYLRELHGDLDGALEAMHAAVAAGGPTVENTQWARVQLGHLYFNRGDLQSAQRQYEQALALLPEYVPAMAGLAQIHVAEERYEPAITLYTEATQRMPLPEYVIALGDIYAHLGDQQNAQAQYDLVQAIDKLLAANGVNTDLETALFFADHGIDLVTSLEKARAAYAARPSTHAADVLAWTLYQTGKYREAQHYSNAALQLGSQDPLQLFHAGMIAHALGQTDQARAYLHQTVALNPHFSLLHSKLAAATLAELGSQPSTRGGH